jgi:hypothetical protein
LNKSSLPLKNILQNTQTLQLLTKIIKTENIYKSNKDAKLEGLVDETMWPNIKTEETQALLEKRTSIKAVNVL